VICGIPIYEYDHMIDWATTHRHRAKEITLLCPSHHSEKTKGLLPIGKVQEADRNPANRQGSMTPGYVLHYGEEEVTFQLGDVAFTHRAMEPYAAIVVDQLVLLGARVEDGHYLLNVNMLDDANRQLVTIQDNELVFSTASWDVEFSGRRLTFRTGSGQIALSIRFAPPGLVALERGRFFCNGVGVVVRPDGFRVSNLKFSMAGLTMIAPIGLALGIGAGSAPALFGEEDVPRYATGWQGRATGILAVDPGLYSTL
jgi:hypothetical protein